MNHIDNFSFLCIYCRVYCNLCLENSLFWINFCYFSFLGHEIIDCSVNCKSDRCRACPHGQVQPFLIQSTTPEVDRKCFTPKGVCDQDCKYTQNRPIILKKKLRHLNEFFLNITSYHVYGLCIFVYIWYCTWWYERSIEFVWFFLATFCIIVHSYLAHLRATHNPCTLSALWKI